MSTRLAQLVSLADERARRKAFGKHAPTRREPESFPADCAAAPRSAASLHARPNTVVLTLADGTEFDLSPDHARTWAERLAAMADVAEAMAKEGAVLAFDGATPPRDRRVVAVQKKVPLAQSDDFSDPPQVLEALLHSPVGDFEKFRARFEHGISNATDPMLRRLMDVAMQLGEAIERNDRERLSHAAGLLEGLVGVATEQAAVYHAFAIFKTRVQRAKREAPDAESLGNGRVQLLAVDERFAKLTRKDLGAAIGRAAKATGKAGLAGEVGEFAGLIALVGAFGITSKRQANDRIKGALKAGKTMPLKRNTWSPWTVTEMIDGPLKPRPKRKS